ncbi:MAG: hypothetical protein ACO3GM_06620, partial [Candidatus Limnocylindrus sp.]
MRALQMYLAGREIASFQSRLTNLASAKLAGEETARALRAKLSSLDTTVMAAEAQLSARGDSGVNDELVRIEQLRGRAKGLLAVLAERRRSVERDRGQLMDSGVVATLEAESSKLREDLAKVNEQLDAVARVNPDSVMGGEASNTLEEARAATQKVNELTAQVRGLNEDIDRLRIAVETDVRNETDLSLRLVQADAARTTAESASDAALALFSTAQSDATSSAARAEALALALDVNSASASALREVEGALGTLNDLIDIDADRRVAVQVALGDSLSGVVAQNVEAARRALQELRQSGSVGAVLALNAITTIPFTPVVNKGQSLRANVRAKSGPHEVQVNRLLDVLFSRVVFVQSWSDA